MARTVLRISLLVLLPLAVSLPAHSQTFEVNQPDNSKQTQQNKSKSKNSNNSSAQNPEQQGIGWGSGIEVAREARAAQQALNKGDYRAAETAAERAARSAPGNAYLWFLYGYTARLTGDYTAAVNAYQRGLQNQPSSIQGLSGLAQTYAKMGRHDEAQDLLKRVLAANPKSVTDLELAGELALS